MGSMDRKKFLLLHSFIRPTESGCIEWLKLADSKGYVNIYFEGRMQKCHRVSYLVFKGEIPAGLTIDHLCRNRKCCNPYHLEAVTARENWLRGESFSARHLRQKLCHKGHVLIPRNGSPGHRRCQICAHERAMALPIKTFRRGLCRRGLHEMTGDNVMNYGKGRTRCHACWLNWCRKYEANKAALPYRYDRSGPPH